MRKRNTLRGAKGEETEREERDRERERERERESRSMCGPVCESMGKMKGDSGSPERRVPAG